MTISDDTRLLLRILQRTYPWARYVSRSRRDLTRTVAALWLHEVLPEVRPMGFAPVGISEELPPDLLPELPEGVTVKLEDLLKAETL